MRRVACLLMFVLWWIPSVQAGSSAKTELVPPRIVALELVRAAKENNLDRVIDTAALPEIYRGPHGRDPRDLIEFLRGIDLTEVSVTGGEAVTDPPSRQESVILETTEGKLRIDFELRTTQWVLGDTEYSHHQVPIPPRYVIVEIHQHP